MLARSCVDCAHPNKSRVAFVAREISWARPSVEASARRHSIPRKGSARTLVCPTSASAPWKRQIPLSPSSEHHAYCRRYARHERGSGRPAMCFSVAPTIRVQSWRDSGSVCSCPWRSRHPVSLDKTLSSVAVVTTSSSRPAITCRSCASRAEPMLYCQAQFQSARVKL